MNPYFVDNRDGNTLARAIQDQLRELRAAGWLPGELCIATAYFNPAGWKLLAEELRRLPAIRLLLGAEPVPEAQQALRQPADPREPEFTREKVRTSLERLETGLRHDRAFLPFDPEEDRLLRELIEFLRSGRIEVRRYTRHFLHAKAFLFRGPERGLLAGSSNLTRAGLQSNLELNLGHYGDPLLARVERWYEELWAEAQPFDLASLYEELLAEYPPYLIYLKILWQLYHAEIAEEAKDTGGIPVTTFQLHGVWRARRILREYGGVLIADGVGLGKTFTAGEMIREYRERRQRVLLVCPAALRDTTWERFLHDYQLLVECLSYEQLANDQNFGGDQHHLKSPLEDYALVVVDEAHNYRNPDAPTRAEVLRRLLAGKRRDLVLLTATPVNNSLWDLYHILRFFLRQDARLSRLGDPLDPGRLRAGDAGRPVRPEPRPPFPDHRRHHGQAHAALREEALLQRSYPCPGRPRSSRSASPGRSPFPSATTWKSCCRDSSSVWSRFSCRPAEIPCCIWPATSRRVSCGRRGRSYQCRPGRTPAVRPAQALRVVHGRLPADPDEDA